MRLSYLFLAAAIVLQACSSSQKLAQTAQQADLYYYQKDYNSAFESYSALIESYVSKKQQVPGELYSSAGKCLYYMESRPQAMEFFKRAEEQGVADEMMMSLRVKYYGDIDNMSLEVENLERYSALYPEGADIDYVNMRLFKRYCEMKEYRKAYLRHAKLLPGVRDSVSTMEAYYTVCKKLEKDDEAGKVAEKLYSIDNNNLVGLSYVAYQTFKATEDEYVAAIKAYEAKKTNAAYTQMVRQTAPLADRYRKARDLYLKLYGITKKPFDAQILSRIYTRLKDKQKADYYAKLGKG